MTSHTRRGFLTVAAASGLVVVAGCIGDDDDETTPTPDEDQLPQGDIPAYIEWVPAGLISDEHSFIANMDVHTVMDTFPEEFTDEIDFTEFAEEFGIDVADLESFMVIEADDAMEEGAMVVRGSFDPQDVLEAWDVEDYDEYEDYLILFGFVAISEDAIIMSESYEAVIDAAYEGTDRVIDVRDHWESASRAIETPAFAGYEEDAEETWELFAFQMDAGEEDLLDLVGYAFYADADTAEAELDDFEDEIEDELEDGEITSVTRIDNVIVVEASVTAMFFDDNGFGDE